MNDLTTSQAAELIGVSESHVRHLVRCQLLPSYRVGRLIRIPRGRFDEWRAEGGTAAPVSPPPAAACRTRPLDRKRGV